jgi:hypothetical protein
MSYEIRYTCPDTVDAGFSFGQNVLDIQINGEYAGCGRGDLNCAA